MFHAANQSSKQFVRPPVTFLELIYSDKLCVALNGPSFPDQKKRQRQQWFKYTHTRLYKLVQRDESQQRIGFRYSVWELLVLLRREFKMHTLQEQQCESLTLEKNQTLYKAENSQGCGHRSHGDIIWHNFKSVLTWAKGNRWEHTRLWEGSRPSRSEWFWIE